MLNSTPQTCDLPELLAACLAASAHAGRVIREVVRSGTDLAVVNKADGAYDPQTVRASPCDHIHVELSFS